MESIVPAEDEFTAAQQLLRRYGEDALFDKSIKSWFTTADRTFFKGNGSQSLRDILSSPFRDVSASLANDGMSIVILISAIKRACRDLARPFRLSRPRRDNASPCRTPTGKRRRKSKRKHVSSALQSLTGSPKQRRTPEGGQLPDPELLPEGVWAGWCRNINLSRLERYPLGFYARCLRNLPRRLWENPIGMYSRRSLHEVRSLARHGRHAFLEVVRIISDLARTLDGVPQESHTRVLILPAAILDVTTWINRVLKRRRVPPVTSMVHGFVRPLLRQLDLDLGPQIAEMVERRIGVDGPPETLEEIAHDFRLTRERIRQHTKSANGILRLRWPEGRYLLDDFYDLLRGSHHAQEQVELLRRVVDVLFDFAYAKTVSHAEIHEAWEKLGRQKRTPMNESDIQAWLASKFPLVTPDVALAWIKDHALVAPGANGDVLYFTKAPQDRLLYDLHTSGAPLTLADAAEIMADEERNVRCQLERDPRFVEDEYKRVLAAENCSFCRFGGVWHVRVERNRTDPSPRSASINLERLSQLICTGLLELGVSDATVWGVQRYANKILAQMRYGVLPSTVSPFILANKLVRHSEGMIRVMRRRRLRWDDGDGVPPARGKLGWVAYVIDEARVPITIRELDSGLRQYYQDYEWYVLSQINFNEDEDGDRFCPAQIVPGYTKYLPAIIVPTGWRLDVSKENVSDEIKLLVAKIIAAGRKRGYPKKVLEDVPWLVELVERHSYGKMQWSDERPPRDEPGNGGGIRDDSLEGGVSDLDDEGRQLKNDRVKAAERIENLLSRFF